MSGGAGGEGGREPLEDEPVLSWGQRLRVERDGIIGEGVDGDAGIPVPQPSDDLVSRYLRLIGKGHDRSPVRLPGFARVAT